MIENKKIEQLLECLNKIPLVTTNNQSYVIDEKMPSHPIVYINIGYAGDKQAKFDFIERIASILVKDDTYDGNEAMISMIWNGDKGRDGINEPYIELRLSLEGIDTIVEILYQYQNEI
ncbi:hypothetical protein ACFLVU_01435 [Chloroflexota bacterium]